SSCDAPPRPCSSSTAPRVELLRGNAPWCSVKHVTGGPPPAKGLRGDETQRDLTQPMLRAQAFSDLRYHYPGTVEVLADPAWRPLDRTLRAISARLDVSR